MRLAKKSISLILILSLLAGMFSVLSISANADSSFLELNTSEESTAESYETQTWYFTPETDGRYSFKADSDVDGESQIIVYDSDYYQVGNEWGGTAVKLNNVYLNEGEQYSIEIAFYPWEYQENIDYSLVVSEYQSVKAIEYQPKKEAIEYVEQTGGTWDYNNNGYYYFSNGFSDGDVINLTFEDGSHDSFTYYYMENVWLNSEKKELDRYAWLDDDQYEEPWVPDGDNYVRVRVDDTCSNKIPVTIIKNENAITAIEYQPLEVMSFTEHEGGYGNYGYYHYSTENYHSGGFCTGDKLIAVLRNGTRQTYTYREQVGWCGNSEDMRFKPFVRFYDSQDTGDQWEIGGKNEYWIQAGGFVSNKINAVIKENPKAPIAVTYSPKQTFTLAENTGGHYDSYNDGYKYDLNELTFLEGDKLTVKSKDGAKTVYTFNSEGKWLAQSGEELKFDVELYNSQDYQDANWTVGGRNYYWAKVNGVASNKISAVIVPGDKIVKQLQFKPAHVASFIEENGGRWTTASYAYDNFYFYNISNLWSGGFCTGDQFVATYKNGKTETFTFTEQVGWQNATGESFPAEVYMTYVQNENNHWGVGEKNYYGIRTMGVDSNNISATIEANDKKVESFKYIPNETFKFVEQNDGWWEDNGKTQYFSYNKPGFNLGDKIVLTLKDKTQRTFTFSEQKSLYDDEGSYYCWLDGEEDLYDVYQLRPIFRDNQSADNQWTAGGKNCLLWVNAFGKNSEKFNAEVAENPKAVTDVKLLSGVKSYSVMENTHGRIWTASNISYFAYEEYEIFGDYDSLKPGDEIELVYRDGSHKKLTLKSIRDDYDYDECWVDENGEIDEQLDFSCQIFSNQTAENPWGVGRHSFKLSVFGKIFDIPVTITKSNIKNVELKLAKPIVINQFENGFFKYDKNGNEWFYYFLRDEFFKNSVLSVTNTDGTTKEYTEAINKYFDLPDGLEFNCSTQQDDTHWKLGRNYIDASVGNYEFKIPVEIVKKGVDSIQLEQKDYLVLVENQDGKIAKDSQGKDYFEYQFNINQVCKNGTVLKIYYLDESFETYVKTDAGFVDSEGNLLESVVVKSNQSAEHWVVGNNTAFVEFIEKQAPATVKVQKHTHDWGEWTVTKRATCVEQGERTRVCKTNATHIEKETIAITGHTPAAAVQENVKNATCTEKGSYESVVYCSVCHKELSRQTVEVEMTGHSYESKTVKPTSTALGYTLFTCTSCAESYKTDFKAQTGKMTLKHSSRTHNAIKVQWKNVKTATGYQVQISTKGGKKWDKYYDLKAGVTSYTFKKLAAGNIYKFRVRSYIKGEDGKNYYSPWSSTLTSPTLPEGTALSKLKPASKSFSAQWKKQTNANGYQLQYSTSSKFAKAKTLTFKNVKTLKATVKKLSAKKVYYVRIRTYKTISKVNYFSAWSKTYKVKTK